MRLTKLTKDELLEYSELMKEHVSELPMDSVKAFSLGQADAFAVIAKSPQLAVYEQQLQVIRELREALTGVSLCGGNLPDDRLTDRTGPNDAASRGMMYCMAREISLKALDKTKDYAER